MLKKIVANVSPKGRRRVETKEGRRRKELRSGEGEGREEGWMDSRTVLKSVSEMAQELEDTFEAKIVALRRRGCSVCERGGGREGRGR